MPLLDHFNLPLSRTHPWRTFHGAWVAAIVRPATADDGEPRLTAAIELLSPRNKDRPKARRMFAIQCVGYLRQGKSVVVVDPVTIRRADLNTSLLSLLR